MAGQPVQAGLQASPVSDGGRGLKLCIQDELSGWFGRRPSVMAGVD